MLSGASLGTCDVPSVRGAASCFSGGTDWPGAPGLVTLSRTIVGGAALGWGARWVMYGALVAGLNPWHTCVVSLPKPWHLVRVPHGALLVRGSFWPQSDSRMAMVSIRPQAVCQWTETQAHTPAGRLTLSL